MSNRGEPPLHCAALLSVNEADVNVCPARPVMSAPAAAFVAVGQFFSRWSTPLENVATGQPVLPGSKTPGTSAAAAVEARASVSAAVATMIAFFMWGPPVP